ncbi:MAG: mannose-ethanolamine phosphotransferase gpi13 [Thelocarpon impressellum]|nr:MAG: mannose-ethanolamine phosphotransferase gpi13 [Thelocarpon impressellum]
MADDLPDHKTLAARFARAKAREKKSDASSLPVPEHVEAVNAREELQFKASHAILIAFLAWVFLIHALGIYFFTKGFLLTRLVLDHKSTCATTPVQGDGTPIFDKGSPEEGCWHPKSFDKAVVVIIDALRYDFTVPFEPGHDGDTPRHFHNALPLFHEIASREPNNAFLLPFIADPPTTTLQRLKGLTTGTLPTFIDAGSNFAGTAIEEDNLIAQLRDRGSRVVHLGDDTWHSLFPGYFDANLTHKYDSFNVWDLHTVDDGVTEHLLPLLQPANTSKWDVLIGHYLGVDHAGHRYGPDHPAMTAKLRQMDDVFREVMDILDDQTLLVVMGDHGMDTKGDHGGESYDEVQAALWMYSKKGLFGRTSPDYIVPPRTARERPVGQIDLVPTLSLLLGLPIPFNNLGAPIDEAFVGSAGNDWENLAVVNHLTAAQIKRYQQEYALARGLDSKSTAGPLALWRQASAEWEKATTQRKSRAPQQWRAAYEGFSTYQRETLSICRGLWARFDVPSMVQGILILASGVGVLIVYARGTNGDVTDVTPTLVLKVASGTGLGMLGGAGVSIALPDWITTMDGTLLGFAAGGLAGFGVTAVSIRARLLSLVPDTLWGWLAVVFTLSQSIGFASNSYTIWEDEILLYFISTFGLLTLVSSLRRPALLDRALGTYQSVLFVVLTRLASLSRLCREEQMPYCRSTYYASANSSTSATWQLFIPFALALIFPDIIKSYYRGTRSYEGSAVFWIGFAFRMGLLLTALFWTLDAADDGEWFVIDSGILKTVRMSIAQLVLAVALAAGSTYFAWAKPCVSIEMKTSPSNPNGSTSRAKAPASTVTVLGYANTHGSRYFLLLANAALAAVLLQKPMGHLSLGILVWQILCLLEMLDTNALSGSAIGPVMLGLLGAFHFFKTGHQATLSSIQWEAAFIPLRSIRYPWSPLLVAGNTFGAPLIATLAAPLVALWKRPTRRAGLLSDVARAVATHLAYHAVVNLATTLWAGHLRRHLMLYRIFSPRWMTGAAVLLVCDVVGVFVAVVAVRVNTLSVAEVFGWA